MMPEDKGAQFYKVGGALGFEHPSYVTRQADLDLLEALRRGQFCYVFNCRQMGKSSLRVRSMQLLQREGMLCSAVDMTMLGSYSNPQQWYGGIITQLFQGFSLYGTINLKAWLEEKRYLSPVQQLSLFISEVLLEYTGDRRVLIFIDEIDKILSLDFSVDDFFALIRFFYNQRAEDKQFHRLTFALFGVATPSDLIQDKTQTLFNIGQAIELQGFSLSEAQPLAAGIEPRCDRPNQVIEVILHWTGGQPFLTQKLCQLLLKTEERILEGEERQRIQSLVQSHMIRHWETQDEPVHFKTIRDRLLRSPHYLAKLLALYQRILCNEDIPLMAYPETPELRLSGLVVERENRLEVYNRIYAHIFDRHWIDTQLAMIRPYAEAMTAWENSHRQDESRLLRGKALRDALQWSSSQNLSQEDYQFLAASQVVDKHAALAKERRRQDVQRLEVELAAEQKAKNELSEAYTKARTRLRFASVVLMTSVVGAAIATGWLYYVLNRQKNIERASLEWAGKGALSQFEFRQIDALLTAMDANEQLLSQVDDRQTLEDFPTDTPIVALQRILDRIQERNHLVGHQSSINSVSISPNDQFIATASRDGTAKIWTREGTEVLSLPVNTSVIYGVSFSPDTQRVATSGDDGNVKIWSMDGTLLQTLSHGSAVYSVKYSQDGQWIATATQDGWVRVWDQKGRSIDRFRAHEADIYSIEFSPDNQQLLTASKDGTARIWEVNGTLLRILNSEQTLYSATFTPDGKAVITAGESGVVEIWTGEQITQTIKAHPKAIYDVSIDPTGQFIATASADESTKLWSVTGNNLRTLKGFQGSVFEASFAHQQPILVTASHDPEARIWDFSRSPLVAFRSNQTDVAALGYRPQGELVTAFAGGLIQIQDAGGQVKSTFQTQSRSAVYDVAIHPDEDQIIVAYKNGHVDTFDFKGGRLGSFKAHSDIIYSVAVHPKGHLIATASKDKTVKLWTRSGQRQKTITGHSGAIYDLDFSSRGHYLATASSDKTSKVFDLTGRLYVAFSGHEGEIHQVRFHPDDKSLVTVSTDETARVWTMEGEELLNLKHQSGLIYRMEISLDGRRFATGSKDGTINLWDFSGRHLDQLTRHQSLIMDLKFTRDNSLVSIAQEDLQVTLWANDTSIASRLEQLLEEGCEWLEPYLKNHDNRAPKRCDLG